MRGGVEGSNFVVQSQQMCPGMRLGDFDGNEQLWLYHLSKSITQVKSGQWRMQATDVQLASEKIDWITVGRWQ